MFVHKQPCVVGKEVVIDGIYNGTGIKAIICFENKACASGGRVQIGISINLSVQHDPTPDGGRQCTNGRQSFDMVTAQVTHERVRVTEGKVGMSKVVHAPKVGALNRSTITATSSILHKYVAPHNTNCAAGNVSAVVAGKVGTYIGEKGADQDFALPHTAA